ncbi:MAG: hypothetical protein ABIC57_03385, partial [bacterium]
LLSQNDIEPEMTLEKEKYFKYDSNGVSHIVYFNDFETLVEKIDTVKMYKIAGIAIWRLGHEDPKNFVELVNNLK